MIILNLYKPPQLNSSRCYTHPLFQRGGANPYPCTREEGETKFWIEPIVSLAVYHGLNPKKLNEIQKIVEEHKN